MSNTPDLITEGLSGKGIVLGRRASGMVVGRTASSARIHLVPPPGMLYAAALWRYCQAAPGALVFAQDAIQTKSDGRLVFNEAAIADADLETMIAVIDHLCANGHRGDPDFRPWAALCAVVPHGWGYRVSSADTALLKRIAKLGRMDEGGHAYVPLSAIDKLIALLAREGRKKAVELPRVPGIDVISNGQTILVSWPGSDEAASILRAVPARWDSVSCHYVVPASRPAALARALDQIAPLKARIDAERSQSLARRKAEEARLRQQEQARLAHERAAAGQAKMERAAGRIGFRKDHAPAVGTLVRGLAGDWRVVDGYGASWRDGRTGRERVYAYTRKATPAEVSAPGAVVHDPSTAMMGCTIMPVEDVPPVGHAIVLSDGTAGVVTGHSRAWLVRGDEHDSSFYSSSLWGRQVVEIDWRRSSTPDCLPLANASDHDLSESSGPDFG